MNEDPPERTQAETVALKGTNQSGMRAHNERLFLSLVRQNGALARSDLARMTGLSAQTVSVIMRELENDGLFLRGEPLRGKIGQPSIPMSLNPDGAFFLGLKLGRRSADLTLIDFLGRVRASERHIYPYPTVAAITEFVRAAQDRLRSSLPPEHRKRIAGLGVAMPFRMWEWVGQIGAPPAAMEEWRDSNLQRDLERLTEMPVFIQNDASSACGAELIFGKGEERPRNFLYFYFGTFIGGGLVMGGQLFLGATGNAAGVGSMPVPGPAGGMESLITAASLQVLADRMAENGEDAEHIWQQSEEWHVSQPVLDRWLDDAAKGLAWATLSATALLELDAVMVDGWMPTSVRAVLTERLGLALQKLDTAGVVLPTVRQGTIGAFARSLGAAAIPLSQRFLIDQNAASRMA